MNYVVQHTLFGTYSHTGSYESTFLPQIENHAMVNNNIMKRCQNDEEKVKIMRY